MPDSLGLKQSGVRRLSVYCRRERRGPALYGCSLTRSDRSVQTGCPPSIYPRRAGGDQKRHVIKRV